MIIVERLVPAEHSSTPIERFRKDIHQMLHIFRTSTHTFSLSQLVPLFLRHSISQLVEKVKVTFLLHKNSSRSKLDTFFINQVITCSSYSRHKQSLPYTNCDRFHGNKCNQRLGASPGNWMMVWRIKKMHDAGQDRQRQSLTSSGEVSRLLTCSPPPVSD